jgi:regulatory protein
MKKTRTISKETLLSRLKGTSIKYLGRYNSSAKNLQKYLTRKVKEYNKEELQENPESMIMFNEAITETIELLKKLGYLNDSLYGKTQLRSQLNKGKSTRVINLKLYEKGLEKQDIIDVLSVNEKEDMELYGALKFIKKKSFGAYRKIKFDANGDDIGEEFIEKKIEKEYASMFRNGFSYDIIDRVIKMDLEETDNFLYDLEKELDL